MSQANKNMFNAEGSKELVQPVKKNEIPSVTPPRKVKNTEAHNEENTETKK